MKDNQKSDSKPLSVVRPDNSVNPRAHAGAEARPVDGPVNRRVQTAGPVNRLKVLFADDEPALQELMHLELPRMGHEVTVCPDGNTAVAALEKNTYDCIIVDLDMPGMNGIQVIAKCKGLSKDTDAVVLTGK